MKRTCAAVVRLQYPKLSWKVRTEDFKLQESETDLRAEFSRFGTAGLISSVCKRCLFSDALIAM
jgi:hypothetical protein